MNRATRSALRNYGLAPSVLAFRACHFGRKFNLDALARQNFTLYPTHRLFFDRIAKNANEYLVFTLEEAVSGSPVHAPASELKQSSLKLRDLSLSELAKIPSYTTFFIKRNPYTRALSMFLDKIAPGAIPAFMMYGGFGVKTKKGFTHFLEYIRSKRLRQLDPHFWSQEKSLVFPVDTYRYVISFENLWEDTAQLLSALDLDTRRLSTFGGTHHSSDSGKETGATGLVPAFYTRRSVELVREIFERDFNLLEYDTRRPELILEG